MSQSKVPLLHEVIPIIDMLTHTLETTVVDRTRMPAIKSAAAKGLAILHKYYSKTDESIMYRCAMSLLKISIIVPQLMVFIVLHPRFKLSYFRHEKWPQSWISTAEDVLRDLWTRHYKPKDQDSSSSATVCLSNVFLMNFDSSSTSLSVTMSTLPLLITSAKLLSGIPSKTTWTHHPFPVSLIQLRGGLGCQMMARILLQRWQLKFSHAQVMFS
jgi:hypothetical protein